jgi:hypothetical protein
MNASTIHFIFEIDDGGTRLVPRQSVRCGGPLHDLIGNERVEIMNSVNVRPLSAATGTQAR